MPPAATFGLLGSLPVFLRRGNDKCRGFRPEFTGTGGRGGWRAVSAEVVGVHVEDDADVFGKGGLTEDVLDVAGQGAGMAGAQEELEAELALDAGGGGGDRHPELDAGREAAFEALMKVLQGEFGEPLVT